MSHETQNLNADAPIEQALRDTATASAGAAAAPVSHDTGDAIVLTQAQAVARLQQGLEFPVEDDVTLLAQGTDLSVGSAATGGGAAAAGTTPGATTASTTPGAPGTGAGAAAAGTGSATGLGTATGPTADTTAGTTTIGGATTTGLAGATTIGTPGSTTATGAGGGATGTDGGITLADLNTLGIDHVVANLTSVASSDLEQNQGNILMELGLDTTATGQQAAAELLALLETFDEPIFNDAANVGVTLSQAESNAFGAASTSIQDDIVTAMTDLGVDFVNVVGTADPDDAVAL